MLLILIENGVNKYTTCVYATNVNSEQTDSLHGAALSALLTKIPVRACREFSDEWPRITDKSLRFGGDMRFCYQKK